MKSKGKLRVTILALCLTLVEYVTIKHDGLWAVGAVDGLFELRSFSHSLLMFVCHE